MSMHIGQEVTAHVTLIDRDDPGAPSCDTLSFKDRSLFRVYPDATVDAQAFKVPPGSFLVITDVEWAAYGGRNGTVPLKSGRTLHFTIHLGNKAQIIDNPFVFTSSLVIDDAAAGGRPGRSEYLTSGFVVAPNTRICPTVAQREPNFTATAYLERLVLRGYIIRAPRTLVKPNSSNARKRAGRA